MAGAPSPILNFGWHPLSCTKVYKISKYETIRETWDGIFMTCGSVWHHYSVSVYYSQNTWESYPTTVVGPERQNWCLDCARAVNSEVVWGLFSNCALLSVRSSGVPLPGAKTQCQGDHQGEQARTRKSLQGTTDCLCSRQNCKGRPNRMSILGECKGLFFWRWRCVSVMICNWVQNIWYKLLTTDGLQWDLYPFSGRQNSLLADNFLPTYGTNALPPDELWQTLNVNFSFLALSLPGMLAWGSSCRNSVYLAA